MRNSSPSYTDDDGPAAKVDPVPQDSVPQNSVPQNSVPVPQDSVPQNPTSQGQEPQGQEPSDPGPAVPRELPNGDNTQAAITLIDGATRTTQVGAPLVVQAQVTLPPTATFVTIRPVGNPYIESGAPPALLGEQTYQVPLVIFRPGTYHAEGLELLWINDEGVQVRTRSEAFSVQVTSVIANESAPELAPPGDWIALRSQNLLVIGLLAGIAVTAIVALAVATLRRRPRVALPPPPPAPARPAWETALEALDQLEADALLDQGAHLEFHTRLSEIVRNWVEGRYGIPAMEMTTREVSRTLNTKRLSVGHVADAIEQILSDTDFVKFANFIPPVDGSRFLFDQSRALVLSVQADDIQGESNVPDPIDGPIEQVADAVTAAPQPQAPGAVGQLRASQGPLPENVIQLRPRDRNTEDSP